MSIEISGLLALGVLNLALGLLIVFVCFRLSALNKLVSDVEKRISRLEILDKSWPDSKDSKAGTGRKAKSGGHVVMRSFTSDLKIGFAALAVTFAVAW